MLRLNFLEKYVKMSQFQEFNFPEYSLNRNHTQTSSDKNEFCVSCFSKNMTFVNLSTCKHSDLFEVFAKFKEVNSSVAVCIHCHTIMKKFSKFKNQVEENFRLLNDQTFQLRTNGKTLDLHRGPFIEINFTYNNQPIEFEYKEVPSPQPIELKDESTNDDPAFEIGTEVKVEHDDSDLETDLPLSEIKKVISKKDKKKKRRRRAKEIDNAKPKKTQANINIKARREIVALYESGYNISQISNEVGISVPKPEYEGKIKIVSLTKEELMSERDSDRSKEAYLKLPYKCELCIVGFDYELTLQDHMDKRHTEKKGCFVCDICKSVLSSECSYKEHCKRHLRRYECEACGKRYNTLQAVIQHYNECHGVISTNFTCDLCGFTTESNRKYRYHRDKHKEKAQCTVCGNTFVNKTGLKIHMFTIHKQSSRVYSCKSCDKVYAAKSGLLAHVASAHSGAPPSAYCAPCRAQFRSHASLRHHLVTHSRHLNQASKRFACDECGSKFLTKPALQEHIDWVHLKKAEHQCDKCPKVFKNARYLHRHQEFVHEKKRLPRNKICDHCGRGFTTLSILRAHIRTHTGERPLRCSHCAAAFAHSAALYTHNKLLHAAQNT